MLHPMTEATLGKLNVDDPWMRNRKANRSADITSIAA
jgi:hypothetical protein